MDLELTPEAKKIRLLSYLLGTLNLNHDNIQNLKYKRFIHPEWSNKFRKIMDNTLKENPSVKKVLSNDFNKEEDVIEFTKLLDEKLSKLEISDSAAKSIYCIYAVDAMQPELKLIHYIQNLKYSTDTEKWKSALVASKVNDELWAKHVHAIRYLYDNLGADPFMLRETLFIAFGAIKDHENNSLVREYKNLVGSSLEAIKTTLFNM